MKYVKSKENLCDYSSRHLYKDPLKLKELIYCVDLVAHDATTNVLTMDIVMKATKNDTSTFTSSYKISQKKQLLQTW